MGFYKLNVPITEKDEAKVYGAQWYPSGKYWYYIGDSLPEGLKRWYPEADEETDLYSKYKSVSEINDMIAKQYKSSNEFQKVYVKGEVTGFSGKKDGNSYFSIKDGKSVLACIIWGSEKWNDLQADARQDSFTLKNGQQVAIFGKLEYYTAGGKTNLHVWDISDIGEGLAKKALEQLEKKLEAEGLFDAARKKPFPKHPKRIGILTSAVGLAIQDIESSRKDTNPYVQTYLVDVNVQGKRAVDKMLEGLKVLDDKGYDFIIIGRGGGSEDDLYVFNDEKLCRAVAAARTPIVTAIGHKGNVALLDHIADACYITPTDVVLKTIPNVKKDIENILKITKNMSDKMNNIINDRRLRIRHRLSQIEANSPEAKLKEKKDRLLRLSEKMRLLVNNIYNMKKDKPSFYLDKMKNGMMHRFDGCQHRYEKLLIELNGLSPTSKLIGGFGYISKDDKPVTDTRSIRQGDKINIRLRDGKINATVDSCETLEE